MSAAVTVQLDRLKPLLHFLTLVMAAAFLTAGCRGGGADGLTTIARDEVPPEQPSPLVPVVFGPTADRQSDPFALDAAAVSGNILSIRVSYSGGCRNHQFVLTAADSFLESSPVQLRLVLTHDANNDTCEAYPTELLRFDLTPIRERYLAAYRQDSGTVRLLLHPAPDTDQPLDYQF